MSDKGRVSSVGAGYGRSDIESFVIPSGETGANVNPVDLKRNYGFIVVRCENATGIASGTMSAQVGYASNDTLVDLYTRDMSSKWESMTLPTSGGFAFLLESAIGIQRIKFILSANSNAQLVFNVYGFDPAIGDR